MNTAPGASRCQWVRDNALVSVESLAEDPVSAALQLLGATIASRGVRAVIVEVEAYGGPADGPWPDAASHSFRGLGNRNAVMFGPAGSLYTYRSHGIHVCANVTCGREGTAAAVLLRAAAIEAGAGIAQFRRGPSVSSVALARGPGNLCAALAISMHDNGVDVFAADSPVTIRLGDRGPNSRGPRVGVSRAADRQWRFWLSGRPEVSSYRRSPRAPAPGGSD